MSLLGRFRLGIAHGLLLSLILMCMSPPASSDVVSDSSTGCRLVILGASYAKDWPIQQLDSFRIVNRGIGGNQSFEMADRFESDVVALDPDGVILWGFINDIFRADPSQIHAVQARIVASYKRMLAVAHENDISVILATEVSIREPAGITNWLAGIAGKLMGKTSYQTVINGHVLDVNRMLLSLARSEGIDIFDFHTALSGNDGHRLEAYATDDGSHLSMAAYDALTRYSQENLVLQCGNRDNPEIDFESTNSPTTSHLIL